MSNRPWLLETNEVREKRGNKMTKNPVLQKPEILEFPVALQGAAPPAVSREAREFFREGVAHLQCGEAAEAVAALSQSVEHAPAFPEAHVFLGIAHALSSNIYPAIDHLEEAAELSPGNFIAHYTRAQLYFKLRTPQPGYEAAERALKCVQNLEQRKMLTQLLKEERARAGNGMARPSFTKPFSNRMLLLAGSALVAAIISLMVHMR
jgi:tetratricopeptide (TPR) repeat protein